MKKNRHETEKEINVRAWKDPAFKKRLHTNPHEALREMGMQHIPSSVQIKIIDEDANTWCIVLQNLPEKERAMSDEELKKRYAAGKGPRPSAVCSF